MNRKLLLDLMQSFSLSAYITRTAVEHLNDQSQLTKQDGDKRAKLLTGFDGSQGTAITSEKNSVYRPQILHITFVGRVLEFH